jgi:predicted TIM-barrel fold metal-dependent hydrolase
VLTIDADAHVIETERTWDYLEEGDRRYRPIPITVDMPSGRARNFWIIDGRLVGGRDNVGKETPKESREMGDIEARLRHMDEIGTDVQVLYPTLFLRPVTDRPEVELALCRSYNRWLADIWAKGKGRLRWAVQLPLLSMEQSLEELRWARAHGACAVFMRGMEPRGPLHNAYFFPLYEEASRLNIPVGIHSGVGSFSVVEAFGADDTFRTAKLVVIGAFHAMIMKGIPERFPRLRIGAIEVAAQWVPYLLHDLNLRLPKFLGKEACPDVLRGGQLFVACQTDDDLPYVLKYSGEDSLMIGSDYGHADNASELLALRRLKEKGELDSRVVDKILSTNPARFYGLDSD